MKLQTVIMLLTCLGLVSVGTAQSSDVKSYYCGRRLAYALDYFCDGNLIKRSEDQSNGQRFQPAWPRLLPSRALTMGSRTKRQVVAECCDKPCSVNELTTYCGV